MTPKRSQTFREDPDFFKNLSEASRKFSEKPNTGNFDYPVGQTEAKNLEYIRKAHGESLVEDVIPALLKNKAKIKIAVLGSGNALFCDEIRKQFGKSVEVVSTGLSKKNAVRNRKAIGAEPIHKKDIVIQSVRLMNQEPEFDLIIDTYGEQFYSTNHIVDEWIDDDILAMRKGLNAVSRNI